MTIICTPDPFPSYSSIRNSIRGLFPRPPINFPGLSISLPNMPAMPSINWASTLSPNLELEMFANQLQSFQELSIMSVAYKSLISVLSIPLPNIPSLPNVNLDTLLQLNPNNLLSGFTVPNINGLYKDLEWPEMQQLSALQIAVSDYQRIMIDFLFSLANQVADILLVSPLSALPEIPNAQTIFSSINQFSSLSFPGFAIDLSVPDPLIPGFDFPEYEKGQILKMIMNSLPTASLKTIVEFITNTLQLPVPLAAICLPVTVA